MKPKNKKGDGHTELNQLRGRLTHKEARILSSWESSNPGQVKEWAKDRTLKLRLTEAVDRECNALEKAKADGMTHLADHEIFQLYGGPDLKL